MSASMPGHEQRANVHQLVRLLQLASPALPIGGYSYSQGIEWAVECGDLHDASTTRAWLLDGLVLVMGTGEAAFAAHLVAAARAGRWDDYEALNAWFRASRETAELRAETEQMGASLLKLLVELDVLAESTKRNIGSSLPLTLPAAFSLAIAALHIDTNAGLTAYVWSWLENQVLAAMKLVPLGQSSGQRLLFELGARIPEVVSHAMQVLPDEITTFAPGLALASSFHETQYSRLFRS
jgi:urease accessory protein